MPPLVSIVLRNYNYAHYVKEALDSAYRQTYKNIELIIADDASTDDSLAVITNWLLIHQDRFDHTELLTTPHNLGQTVNMNRGVHASRGKYVFQLDADNTIADDGIKRLVEYCEAYPETKFLFAKLSNHPDSVMFPGSKDAEIYAGRFVDDFQLTAQEQYRRLVVVNFVSATQPFYNREELIKVGLFDERIPNLEDYPMWIKITSLGYKLYYLNSNVGFCRIHGGSISNYNERLNKTSKIVNEKEHQAIKQILYYYKVPALIKHRHYLLLWELMNRTFYRDLVILFGNKRTWLVNFLAIIRWLSPIYVKEQCKE